MTEMAFTTRGLAKVDGEGRLAVRALLGINPEVPKGEIAVLLGSAAQIHC